jgi:hypothetical protein
LVFAALWSLPMVIQALALMAFDYPEIRTAIPELL